MELSALKKILKDIPSLRVAVLGDACLDIYWDADMTLSEISREVPQFPMPIVAERHSLGAGANVAANLAALGVKDLRFVGAAGKDWRGESLKKLFREQGISDEAMTFSEEIVTPAYCKPILHGISPVTYEAPRLDFVNRSPLPANLEAEVLDKLKRVCRDSDILVVCDQFRNGAVSEAAIEWLSSGAAGIPVVVDSRDRLGQFRKVAVKPNEIEACRALGIPPVDPFDMEAVLSAAAQLSLRQEGPVLMTLGANGAVWQENGSSVHVPGYPVRPPIDFVGAGDSFLAGFAVTHALGVPPENRLSFAALVSAVTIKKLGMTGTASPAELEQALELYSR